MLSHSLGTFQIMKAAVRIRRVADKPLEWHYTLEADRYAKTAGDLLLVRPRVFGRYSSGCWKRKSRGNTRSSSMRRSATRTSSRSPLPAGYVVGYCRRR